MSAISLSGRPAAWYAAVSVPTIAPAEVPAMRGNEYPCSCSTWIAPTSPIPLTPPPSSTRSAFLALVTPDILAPHFKIVMDFVRDFVDETHHDHGQVGPRFCSAG